MDELLLAEPDSSLTHVNGVWLVYDCKVVLK